jgi:hypothetical protein
MHVDRQQGEFCIRASAPAKLSLPLWPCPGPQDIFNPYAGEKALVLTNQRLLWLRRSNWPLRGKTLKEIPLAAVRSCAARVAFHPSWWAWVVPLLWTLPHFLLTRRLEIVWEEGERKRKLRLHISDARGWAQDILRVAQPQP